MIVMVVRRLYSLGWLNIYSTYTVIRVLVVESHYIYLFCIIQSFSEFTSSGKDVTRKESLIAEAELASAFHQLLQDQGQTMANPEQEFSTEVRLTVNSRRRSLDNIRRPSKSQNSAILDFK